MWRSGYYHYIRRIRSVPLLDLVEYSKTMAKERLIEKVGWRDYGGKHYESVFTRFYQGYILPRKFGVDKRRAHLSNLILTGEISREAALAELQQPTYDEALQQADKAYVAKKLGWSEAEFEAILDQPNVPHEAYGSDDIDRQRYKALIGRLSLVRRAVTPRRGAQDAAKSA